jgi:hypothetical protein
MLSNKLLRRRLQSTIQHRPPRPLLLSESFKAPNLGKQRRERVHVFVSLSYFLYPSFHLTDFEAIHSMDSSTSEAMATPAPIEVRDEVEEDEVVVPCKNNVSEEAEESDLTDDAPSDDDSSYLLPVLKTRNRRKKGEGTGLRKTHPQNTTKLYEAFTEPSKRRADRMLVHDLEYKGEAGPKSLLSAFCRWVEARERQQVSVACHPSVTPAVC